VHIHEKQYCILRLVAVQSRPVSKNIYYTKLVFPSRILSLVCYMRCRNANAITGRGRLY